jgi:hypothetical protein
MTEAPKPPVSMESNFYKGLLLTESESLGGLLVNLVLAMVHSPVRRYWAMNEEESIVLAKTTTIKKFIAEIDKRHKGY